MPRIASLSLSASRKAPGSRPTPALAEPLGRASPSQGLSFHSVKWGIALDRWFSTGGGFVLQKNIRQCLETFSVSYWGGCYWHLLGRPQRCCPRSYSAQDGPLQQRIICPKCQRCCGWDNYPGWSLMVSPDLTYIRVCEFGPSISSPPVREARLSRPTRLWLWPTQLWGGEKK